MKKYLLTVLSIILTLPAFAFEDCIITTKGKLSDIKIQYNDIIDVYPLITITNDKNTLIVHPLKQGCTKFSIMKDNKDKIIFNVEINDEGTIVDKVEGFDILTIDCPPGTYEYLFDLDEPPGTNLSDEINVYEKVNKYYNVNREYIKLLDEPPVLRGAD